MTLLRPPARRSARLLALRPTTTFALVACAGLAAPIALAADAPEDLPVRSITLYRSGVGYFEHSGKVKGDGEVTLRFDANQINDILKSLVVLDAGGGRVEAVRYSAKEPLGRRLASFGVNIADNPSVADLLGRLRGAKVRLTTSEGAVEGTILGVERRTAPTPVPGPENRSVVMQDSFVNLITDRGVRSVGVTRIASFELLDKELANELNMALAALAEQRNEKSATVGLALSGKGERNVAFGYIHETPVWKTSYRLVLPDGTGNEPLLQGWAIVENTTDQDWNDVHLSLVSGSPIAFTMDLHEPLFSTRPQLPVPAMAFGRPMAYGAEVPTFYVQDKLPVNAPAAAVAPDDARRLNSLKEARGLSASVEGGHPSLNADDPAAATQALATAGEVGEQFRYDIGAPVSIERQRSAMLPIVAGPIKGERVSIYTPSANREHPMRGVEIANTSGFELSPGPITVFDSAAYAGDAQIGFTSRDQTRLLSYAVDLDVRATTEDKTESDVVRIAIASGLIRQERKSRHTTDYTFTSEDARRGRTILVEHPKPAGWDLVEPKKPRGETDTLRRFEVGLDPGKGAKLQVVEERTDWTSFAVTSMDLPTLLAYAKNGKASQKVVDAVRKAADMQAQINSLKQQIEALDAERAGISADQTRIRGNMNTIDRQSDLWGRYMKKLNDQETRLESMREQSEGLRKQADDAQAALNAYLRDLNVI